MIRAYRHTGLIRLLDADPDLARGVDPELAERLRQRVLAEAVRLEPGTWDPNRQISDDVFGVLILDGLLIKSATIADRRGVELYGQGDVIRPARAGSDDSVGFDVEWRVLNAAWLALLDADFQAVVARCPPVLTEIIDRIAAKSSTAQSRALAQIPTLDHRLLVLLWQLADRWGTVRPDGVLLGLDISQTTLGELVGAQRQSVSRSIGRMVKRGALTRRPDGWLLGARPASNGAQPHAMRRTPRMEAICVPA